MFTAGLSNGQNDRIVTHADGAMGVQISQPIPTLIVRRGIETFGGEKPGGSAQVIKIA